MSPAPLSTPEKLAASHMRGNLHVGLIFRPVGLGQSVFGVEGKGRVGKRGAGVT